MIKSDLIPSAFCIFLVIGVIWQEAERALYGFSQDSVIDAICAVLLSFFIAKEIYNACKIDSFHS